MRAFTLTETIVVIAILTTAGLALQNALATFYRQNTYVLESSLALESARRGLNVALENLREATYGEDGAYPIISAATSSLSFHADVDSDQPVERVAFFVSDSTLYRTVTNASGNPPSYAGQTAATSTVIDYVRNATSTPIFRYYDGAGSELTAPVSLTDVAQVTIHLDTDINPNRAPQIYTLSGTATIRNLRD